MYGKLTQTAVQPDGNKKKNSRLYGTMMLYRKSSPQGLPGEVKLLRQLLLESQFQQNFVAERQIFITFLGSMWTPHIQKSFSKIKAELMCSTCI